MTPSASIQRWTSALAGEAAASAAATTSTARRSVIVPAHDDRRIGRRRHSHARSPALVAREEVARLRQLLPIALEERQRRARLARVLRVLALRVEHARQRAAPAGIVAEQADGGRPLGLGGGKALEPAQEAAAVAAGRARCPGSR